MSNKHKPNSKMPRPAPSTGVDVCLSQGRLKQTAHKPSSDGFVHQPLASANGKRRLFRFGPGLFLAILASVAVWAFMPREPSRMIPSPASSTPAVASAPDPHWLIRHAEALALTPEQTVKLSRLVARWDRDTAPLRRELDAATKDLQKRMPGRPGSKLSVQQFRQEAAPMAALSGQLAEARKAWWTDARTVLTPDQRARAEAAWAGQWNGRGPANKELR